MTGPSLGKRIVEFHGGKTYAKTKAKHGKDTANKQAVAAAIASMQREGRSIAEIYKTSRKKKR